MILDKTYNLESLDDLGKVNNDVVDSICTHVSLDDKLLYNVKLVISELVINGFVHGNKTDVLWR